MSTIREYIRAEMEFNGMQCSDVLMDGTALAADLEGSSLDDSLTSANLLPARKVLALMIRRILAAPDVSEGSYSAKWDREKVSQLHATLCQETGLVNTLAPQVKDLSNLW